MHRETEIEPILNNLLKGFVIPDFKSDDYLKSYDSFFDNIKVKVELKKLKEKYKDKIKLEKTGYVDDYSFLNYFLTIISYVEMTLRHDVFKKEFNSDFYKKLFKYTNENSFFLKEKFFLNLKQRFFIKDIIYFLNRKGKVNPTKFLGAGCFGNTFELSLGYAIKLFFCEKEKDSKDSVIYEEIVGRKVCNEIILKNKIPNLIYTYGLIENEEDITQAIIKDRIDLETENILNSFLYLNPNTKVLFIQYIDDSITFKKFLKTKYKEITLEIFKEIFDQVFLTLHLLNKTYKMAHNDLHCENILVIDVEKSKFNIIPDYPLQYYNGFFIEKKPSYIPYIIDYGFATFTDPETDLYYCPVTKKSFFANSVNNDIYLFCLNSFKYVIKYKVEDARIYDFLYNILVTNFLSSSLIDKLQTNDKCYYDLIFKRIIKDEKKDILTGLVQHLKKDLTIKYEHKDITIDYEKLKERHFKQLDYQKRSHYRFIAFFIKNFYYLSFIKNEITTEEFTEFLKLYDKKKIGIRFKTSSFKNNMLELNKQAFEKDFSTVEKLTEYNIDVYADIMKDYAKESAYKDFDRIKFMKWYNSVNTVGDVFFYIVSYTNGDDKNSIPLGFVGFKNDNVYKKKELIKPDGLTKPFFIEIYLKKEYTGKGLGELVYTVAEKKFFEDASLFAKQTGRTSFIDLYSSIFKDNQPSISFFKNVLKFEEYKSDDTVVLLKKR